MTKRAIIFCILFVSLLTTLGYINDHVLRLESTSNGHQLPIIVVGTLFLFVLCVNPLLSKFCKDKAFFSAELAVIVCVCSCACGIGGRALMEQFTQIVALPEYWVNMEPGWKSRNVMKRFPKNTLVEAEPYDEVVSKFITGSGFIPDGKERMVDKVKRLWRQVPWRQWMPPLMTWGPFILLVNVAMTALALIVHRQWSEYEHLQYPIALYTEQLIEREEGRAFPSVFFKGMFWIGFAAVLIVRLNNGLYQWYPEKIVPVKMWHSFWPFAVKWPILRRNPMCWNLLLFNIFPLATAIAFFLSSEMSLSIGMTQIFWAVISIICVTYGVNMSNDYDIGGFVGWSRAGAYVAYSALLLYSGRHYYWGILSRALCFAHNAASNQKRDAYAVSAMRVLIISVVVLCLLSIKLGLCWPVAIANIVFMLMTFLIVSRISAETGLFFIQPGWQPFGFLMALMGGYAIGPTAIVISGLICGILCIDQSQALMPYLINGLKLAEKNRLSLPKVANANLAIYIFGIIICVATGIIVSYDVGTTTYYPEWNFQRLPTMAIRAAEPIALKLQAIGVLEESEALGGWKRIVSICPTNVLLESAGLGIVCVLICHFLRMRTTWWHIHPCLFLTWCTAPIAAVSWPFLVGWAIKKLCLRFGGYECVQKARPMAIGVIAGEIMGALVFMVAGVIYYLTTGELPKTYGFFPR